MINSSRLYEEDDESNDKKEISVLVGRKVRDSPSQWRGFEQQDVDQQSNLQNLVWFLLTIYISMLQWTFSSVVVNLKCKPRLNIKTKLLNDIRIGFCSSFTNLTFTSCEPNRNNREPGANLVSMQSLVLSITCDRISVDVDAWERY